MKENNIKILEIICSVIIVVLIVLIGKMLYTKYKLNKSYEIITSTNQNKL